MPPLPSVSVKALTSECAKGARLVADTLAARGNGYNVGEEELASRLTAELGYTERGDSGVWDPPPRQKL